MTAAEASTVLDKLERIGGEVTVDELAYQLRLPRAATIEALRELGGGGLVEPSRWRLTDDGKAQVRARCMTSS